MGRLFSFRQFLGGHYFSVDFHGRLASELLKPSDIKWTTFPFWRLRLLSKRSGRPYDFAFLGTTRLRRSLVESFALCNFRPQNGGLGFSLGQTGHNISLQKKRAVGALGKRIAFHLFYHVGEDAGFNRPPSASQPLAASIFGKIRAKQLNGLLVHRDRDVRQRT